MIAAGIVFIATKTPVILMGPAIIGVISRGE